MARPLRVEFEGATYHVTARGNERKKIFNSKRDYDKFLQYVSDAVEKYRFLLHAYVLMGNHYHLIIETPEGNLSRGMHYINSSYTTYTNIKRKRSGHLFQGRFKAIVVDKDAYLLELSRYIHLNPVRAKMVGSPHVYSYSSYRAYIHGGDGELTHTSTILGMMSGKGKAAREQYRDFVEAAIGDEAENPLEKVYGGMILGDEVFKRSILEMLKDRDIDKEEIASRKELRKSIDQEEVLRAVSSHIGMSPDSVLADRRSLARNALVYLLKKYGAVGNREICQLIECTSISAASKICRAFERELGENASLRTGINALAKQFFNFQGPTPLSPLVVP